MKSKIIFSFGTSEAKKMVTPGKEKLGEENVLRQKMRSLIADL